MRRPHLLTVVATTVFFIACSEQPTAPGNRSEAPQSALSSPSCGVSCIQTLINQIFPAGDLLKSANSFWANVQTKVNQGRLADAQAKANDLVTFGLKNFYAGKLIGQMGDGTQNKLAALIEALYQYTGLTSGPAIPPGALSPDGAVAVITPSSPTTTVLTGTKQAGVIVPAGAVTTTTLVTISRLPNSPGPLLTSLDQYPLFYEYASTPAVDFSHPVTTGVCQTDINPTIYNRLRLAHNVGVNFGDVQILPRVDAPFLS